MTDIADGTLIDNKYRVVQKLGFGDAGTVYRVTQLGIDVDRAMKMLDPKLPSVTLETFDREFAAEKKKLSLLTHRNLVKLIDAGDYECNGRRVPYYITDLVHPREGEDQALTLDRWAQEVVSSEAFVNVILQLVDGLSYLHSHRCLHCDIKPNNLLLEPVFTNEYELKIADLGSSKILPSTIPSDTQRTHVVGTVDYAPDYVQGILNTDQTVAISELAKWFPHWDLFSVGATLARIIWKESTSGVRDFEKMLANPKEGIERLLGKDFNLMKRIILRLLDPNPDNSFRSAAILAEAFRKLLPEYLVPLGVSEMAVGGAHRTLTQPREKVYLSDRIYTIIEHHVFQRLHCINQLNFVYMLYSGGKHSRFLHSLATYEMAKRYIEGLLGSSYFKYLMDKEDYELFLVAALLHDIGQYPLAHAIEDLGDEMFTGLKTGVKTDFQMFRYMIDRKGPGQGTTISSILKSRWGMDLHRLEAIICREPLYTETDYFIRSMLDGPIDIDKVSYLIYDSYFTGAPYGLGIDLPGLLSSLVAIPPEVGRHAQLGILDPGVVAAEGVIAARYSMFSRVYWHHFNRAVMAILKYAAAKLFLSPNDVCSFDSYINDTFQFSDLQALRYIHDCLGKVMKLRGPNPLTGLLDGRRSIPRRLLTFSGRSGSGTGSIYRLLVGRNFKDLEALRKEALNKLNKILDVELDDFDLLFDVPKTEKRRDTLEELYVYDSESRGEKYKELSSLSDVTKALCAEFEDHTKKCRVFISDKVHKNLDKDKKMLDKAREEIEGFLQDYADKQNR